MHDDELGRLEYLWEYGVWSSREDLTPAGKLLSPFL
jgi:hypothetical protein